MTFLQLVISIKTKYKFDNQFIIYHLIYKFSKLVKNENDFAKFRNNQIDFKLHLLQKDLKQYINKKPIELILDKAKFYGLDFKVLSGVLIPRPDTEILCEKVIKILSKDKKLKNGVDICCGSGNIAIAIKKNVSNISMDAIDIQQIACKNTKLNAALHKIKINVIKGDFYKTLISNQHQYDFIVCNPPYVANGELDKSMLKYENKINFNNSEDSLYFYKEIIDNYENIFKNKKHFLIAFEIGFNQKKDLENYLKNTPLWKHAKFYEDYNGNDRVLIIYSF